MSDNISEILELSQSPDTDHLEPDESYRWPRSLRLSLRTFIAAIVFFIVAFVVLITGIHSGGFMFDIYESHLVISFISFIVSVLSFSTSIISGFIALPKRKIVLWWLIPSLAGLVLFAFSIFS